MQQWRLIPCFEASGAVQMAIDTWLFEQHCAGLQPSTLRFYTWSPIAISLGYHQRRYPQTWHHLTWQGEAVDVVRRPTGGRAVLHQGDLTYAVITSALPTSRLAAYHYVCEFLIEGWRSLGVSLRYGRAGRGYIHNPNCFGTATGADLVLPNGTKLIGSAQLRRGTTALQHGSMSLLMNPTLYQHIFSSELATELDPETPLTDITQPSYRDKLSHLRERANWQQIIEALVRAAQHCFGADFVLQPLSEEEWQSVLALSKVYEVSPIDLIKTNVLECDQ